MSGRNRKYWSPKPKSILIDDLVHLAGQLESKDRELTNAKELIARLNGDLTITKERALLLRTALNQSFSLIETLVKCFPGFRT